MDSGFQTELSVHLKQDSDSIWVVDRPLKYWSKLLNQLVIIPPWFETKEPDFSDESSFFETDFASVPRVPIFYSMWGDRAHREAVLHDYLYRIDSIPVVTKSNADSIFLEAMKSTGKPFYIRWPMYLGVKFGGWTAFHKKKVKDKI